MRRIGEVDAAADTDIHPDVQAVDAIFIENDDVAQQDSPLVANRATNTLFYRNRANLYRVARYWITRNCLADQNCTAYPANAHGVSE